MADEASPTRRRTTPLTLTPQRTRIDPIPTPKRNEEKAGMKAQPLSLSEYRGGGPLRDSRPRTPSPSREREPYIPSEARTPSPSPVRRPYIPDVDMRPTPISTPSTLAAVVSSGGEMPHPNSGHSSAQQDKKEKPSKKKEKFFRILSVILFMLIIYREMAGILIKEKNDVIGLTINSADFWPLFMKSVEDHNLKVKGSVIQIGTSGNRQCEENRDDATKMCRATKEKTEKEEAKKIENERDGLLSYLHAYKGTVDLTLYTNLRLHTLNLYANKSSQVTIALPDICDVINEKYNECSLGVKKRIENEESRIFGLEMAEFEANIRSRNTDPRIKEMFVEAEREIIRRMPQKAQEEAHRQRRADDHKLSDLLIVYAELLGQGTIAWIFTLVCFMLIFFVLRCSKN